MSMEIICQKNTYLSDNTKFKIVAYWNVRKDGTYYTQLEKDLKKHRKYIDSWDYSITEGGKTITNHEQAFFKLYVYAQKNIARAEKILIYMNDLAEEKQYLICKLEQDFNACQIIVPIFKDDDLGIGHRYVNFLPVLPEPCKLVQRTLNKKPKTILDYSA